MSRYASLGLAGAVIVAGLVLRLGPWSLPLPIHHYGGGILWGAVLYLLVAASLGPGGRIGTCLIVAGILAAAVESSRLLQTPTLDAFRATLAGQLLLGRLFSGWNLPVYALGISLAAGLRAWLSRRRLRDRSQAPSIA